MTHKDASLKESVYIQV